MKKRLLVWLLLIALLCAFSALAEEEDEWSLTEDVLLTDDGEEIPDTSAEEAEPAVYTARDDMIDRIIALGKQKYEETGGKAQRAHYAGDIYVCKNFTVYLFRQTRDDFRMAEYPDVPLVIPNNLPAKECKPYSYGLAWEDISATDGNPFYEAATFRYDKTLSKEENMEDIHITTLPADKSPAKRKP